MSLKTVQFDHEGRRLEVRAEAIDYEIQVRMFENGTPVTAMLRHVPIPINFEGHLMPFPLDRLDALVEMAQEEVEKGRVPLLPSL